MPTLKLLALFFAVSLAIAIFGNFYFISNNIDLQNQLQHFASQNSELSSEVSVLTSKIDLLEEQLSEQNFLTDVDPEPINEPNGNYGNKSIKAVGVRPILLRSGFFEKVEYEGTIMKIEVSIRDGNGLVLVNTEIPTGVDFQGSAKTAVGVAENYLGFDLARKDIIFSITADDSENLQAVDGQSAGVAMSVLLISSLQEKEIDADVVITGTIKPDMTIGAVGGIFEKADAAGRHGAKIFLVPKSQGVTHVESCEESRTGTFIYRSCTLEEKPLSPITEEKFGMKTIEVGNISEALNYFQ